jgi:hypothetical protein
MLFIPPGCGGKLAGMRRRRLMLVGLVALTAVGLSVGWLNRLTKEERQILGTWYRRVPQGGALVRLDFAPDGTCSVNSIDERTGVALWPTPVSLQRRWRVRDGKLRETVDDLNLGLVDRARRMLPAGFPGAVAPTGSTFVVERLTADEFIIRDRYENIARMTRTPPD